jgi:NADPH:quinone reductase-like Zn-dependent oxidoreductase
VRALIINEGELEVHERPTPQPGPRDVLVKVRAAGINAADLMQRRGLYPAPDGWPVDVPGMEFAGVVESVGDEVSDALVGQRVSAIVGGGAQATHCLAPSEHLLALPDHVQWEQAGGFAEAFTTAYDALVTQGHLQPGERVLISGAAGGVGVAAVQIASARGAHVIALSRDRAHLEELLALGASEVISLEEVSSLDGVDVILELVGAAHLSEAQHHLNLFARVVVIGVGAGTRTEVDLRNIMRTRSTLTGSTLRSRSREEKSGIAQLMRNDILPLWQAGTLQVPIANTFDLLDAPRAYDYFAQPGKLGKVVLTVSDDA